ncbi:AAA family ATPase [Fusobacterium sp.]|uniref:AAA family ATPase n=1 Tax=Fusobacterium sp. TaxID=68766 RepID=UPI000C70B653|nr:SMC family ATPase [Fusobacterium sp.]
MKINRVHLENYRVHENLDIKFSKGINLLLGKNGKGKSSILEAIGTALFDSKARSILSEALTYGKKSGKIEIEFSGIDGEDYTITKKIPSGGSKLCRISDGVTLDGKTDKIRELCGINGDVKNIYDNIIVAKQNEFVNAFKDTPTNREAIFNAIFNTDIYKKIGEKDLLKVQQKYESNLSNEQTKFDTISSKIIDPDQLESLLVEKNTKKIDISNKLDQLLIKEQELEKLLTNIQELQNKISTLKSKYDYTSSTITNCQLNIEKIKVAIKQAQQAEIIVKENTKGYKNYELVSNEIEQLKLQRKTIEEKKNYYEKLEKEKTKNESHIFKLNANIDTIQNNITTANELLLEKNTNFGELNSKININKSLELEYNEKIKLLSQQIKKLEQYEAEISNKEKILDNTKKDYDNIEKNIKDIQKSINDLNSLNIDDTLQNLILFESQKIQLEKENHTLNTQKIENKDAYEILKTYQCPYLKESCENLKGKNIENFFSEKILKIDNIIANNNKKIEELNIAIQDKSKWNEKKSKLILLQENYKKLGLELVTTKKEVENNNLAYNLITTQLENFKLKNNITSKDELNKQYLSFKIQLDNLNILENSKELQSLEKSISKIHTDISMYKTQSENITKELKTIEAKNTEINIYLKDNKDIITQFININNNIEIKEHELKSLEQSKNLYLENLSKSNEKEKFVAELDKTNLVLEKEILELSILKKDIEINEASLKQYDTSKISQDKKQVTFDIGVLREEFGKIISEIETTQKQLNETKKDLDLLQKLTDNIKKINTKLELTKYFRENVKNMGKEVSKNMLKEIEIIATENFRKITGRGEKIIWSNEDKDKYLVYLVGNNTKLKFEQLSGGEQVAVAISIRSAMSNIFTDSKFSIFDEPTNNLDSEKRQSLADSIGEILKNLEQSIIVTHDDTFKEMAEKVIYL